MLLFFLFFFFFLLLLLLLLLRVSYHFRSAVPFILGDQVVDMRLESLLPLALAALASADQTCRVCLVDDCFEAIASSGRADCSVYLAADPKLTLPTM